MKSFHFYLKSSDKWGFPENEIKPTFSDKWGSLISAAELSGARLHSRLVVHAIAETTLNIVEFQTMQELMI